MTVNQIVPFVYSCPEMVCPQWRALTLKVTWMIKDYTIPGSVSI